jgi:conserved oligomeric Golgi complex subunit 2
VYFQLRWKEIVIKLEDGLAVTSIDPSVGKGTYGKKNIIALPCLLIRGLYFPRDKDKDPFVTTQAAAVWVAISSCWSAEVYIPELNHRFWKFTLQVDSLHFYSYASHSWNG